MNVQFWFFIHRPLMISVPIVSIIAFLVILLQLKWTWVDSTNQTNYVHSIIGIITISFSVLQVLKIFFQLYFILCHYFIIIIFDLKGYRSILSS